MNEERLSSNHKWIILFILSIIIDSSLIIYATITHNFLLIVILIFGVIGGSYYLYNFWNKDERTDAAIDAASRTVISIFIMITTFTGCLFLTLSYFTGSILWEVGATLIIVSLFLFYLQAIMSVYYENQMS